MQLKRECNMFMRACQRSKSSACKLKRGRLEIGSFILKELCSKNLKSFQTHSARIKKQKYIIRAQAPEKQTCGDLCFYMWLFLPFLYWETQRKQSTRNCVGACSSSSHLSGTSAWCRTFLCSEWKHELLCNLNGFSLYLQNWFAQNHALLFLIFHHYSYLCFSLFSVLAVDFS